MARIKVTITGYYSLPAEGSRELEDFYSRAETHEEALKVDQQNIIDRRVDAMDAMSWMDEDPEVVLELEK